VIQLLLTDLNRLRSQDHGLQTVSDFAESRAYIDTLCRHPVVMAEGETTPAPPNMKTEPEGINEQYSGLFEVEP